MHTGFSDKLLPVYRQKRPFESQGEFVINIINL